MQFEESANGQIAKVKLGATFDIVLPEIRTAGYRWVLTAGSAPTCSLLEDTIQPNPAVGGAGRHRWRFRATAQGDCEIEFRYARPWDSSSEPDKTFRLKVQVRP